MSIVLALASNKGGVGKTTTAVTVGSYFAFRRNWRVLIVDVDIQGHVGLFLGLRDATDIYKESGLQKLLLENQPIEKIAVRARENLGVIPNSIEAILGAITNWAHAIKEIWPLSQVCEMSIY